MADVQAKILSDQDIVGKSELVQDETVQIAGLTPEEKQLEKKLVRKIDLFIMPIILLVYLLNWIDR